MKEELRDEAKVGKWIFRRLEDRLRPKLLRYVPDYIQTYHLTLLTIVWTFLVLLSGLFSKFRPEWLWLTCIVIVAQYITDLLDGTVGRERNTGLVKWGHYMDHVLDFVFFTALMLNFGFLFSAESFRIITIAAFVQAGFMVSMFLNYSATEKFGISFFGFGPTEVRILYLLSYLHIIFLGPKMFETILPYATYILAVLLAIFIYRTQKKIWEQDIREKLSK